MSRGQPGVGRAAAIRRWSKRPGRRRSPACRAGPRLHRFGQRAGDRASAGIRSPTDERMTTGRIGVIVARIAGPGPGRPSPASACRSGRCRTVPVRRATERLERARVARASIPNRASCATRIRRLVALSSTTSARRPADPRRGCRQPVAVDSEGAADSEAGRCCLAPERRCSRRSASRPWPRPGAD